ncbi:hypothetical protein Tco_1507092 [Tanacetum coccineum]
MLFTKENKEKVLEEIAITNMGMLNVCYHSMNKVLEKTQRSGGKFLIPVLLYKNFDRTLLDEIDAFLAMDVSSDFEEGYFDSEGDVTFLDNLLSDDLAPEVISDHEPEQNESSITFSPRSDPLHHEFAGEIITLPSRNDREFEEYLSLMTVFYDLIPLGVENDDSEDEDNELPNLDHQDNPSSPHPPPEPPDVCLNFKPVTAMRNEDFNQGELVLSLNVEDVNSFKFVIWTFLPFFTYHEDSLVILSLSGVRTSYEYSGSLRFLKPHGHVESDNSLCGRVQKGMVNLDKVGMCRRKVATWVDLGFLELIILKVSVERKA